MPKLTEKKPEKELVRAAKGYPPAAAFEQRETASVASERAFVSEISAAAALPERVEAPLEAACCVSLD